MDIWKQFLTKSLIYVSKYDELLFYERVER